MNATLHIRRAGVFLPGNEDAVTAAIETVRDTLPRAGARRMSRLGLGLKSALGDEAPAHDEALVFASAFAMTTTLEDYLASFPHPSPLAFQNSIHPAAIEQVLVLEKRPVGEFYPVSGEKRLLVISALETLFRCSAPVRRLTGGEERGTWMSDSGCGSASTFAYALTVSEDPAGAIGRIDRTDVAGADFTTLWNVDFARAISEKRPLRIGTPDTAGFTLSWS